VTTMTTNAIIATQLADALLHRDAQAAAVAVAESALAAATEQLTSSEAKAIDGDSDIDRAVTAVASSTLKVEIGKKRLALARGRLEKADEVVRLATADALRAEMDAAGQVLAQEDAAVIGAVRSFLDSVGPVLTSLHQAKGKRDALVAQLPGAAVTPVGPAEQALALVRPSTKAALNLLRETGALPGVTIDAFGTITAVLAWLHAEPARALAAEANAKQVAEQRARGAHADALAGRLGQDARDAAIDADRKAMASNGTMGRPTTATASAVFSHNQAVTEGA
jgi:hypothetical protein